MKTSEVLITNGCVITGDGRVFDDGYVHIHGERVLAVGDARRAPIIPDAIAIDANGRYVMPGLINPHMHLYSALARGISVGRMKNFGEVLKGLWWRLDRELTLDDIYLSALIGGVEAIKSGVTTLIDHHASYGDISGSLGTISEAMDDLGIRASLCFEISDRAGSGARDEAIEESALWLDWCMTNSDAKMQRGMVGLHASMTLSDESIEQALELMELYHVGAHVHCAEGIEDVKATQRICKMTPIERFYKQGILREGTLAVHCVHATKKDLGFLKKSGAFVVHNPLSNLNNAVGIADLLGMAKMGIPVAIGTDGMSAGVSDDIRAASVLHKIGANDTQSAWQEIADAVLNVAPKIASSQFGLPVGSIKKNAAADIIIIDAMPPTPVTSKNYWGHILFGILNNRVRTTIINGEIKMIDGELVGIDEAVIMSEAQLLAKKLWKRIGG